MEENQEPRNKSIQLQSFNLWGQRWGEAKNIQWGKDIQFNQCCWENWIITYIISKLDPYRTSLTKIHL